MIERHKEYVIVRNPSVTIRKLSEMNWNKDGWESSVARTVSRSQELANLHHQDTQCYASQEYK